MYGAQFEAVGMTDSSALNSTTANKADWGGQSLFLVVLHRQGNPSPHP